MLLTVAAVQRRQFALAGLCAGLAFWIKLYPVALGLLLVLLYRGKFLKWYVPALVAGFLLPFFLQTPGYVASQYVEWLEYLRTDDRQLLELKYWPVDIRMLFEVGLVPLAVCAPARAATSHTAYVANANANSVTPIDTTSNTPGSAISVGSGPVSVALTPDARTAYVANAGSNSISVIDTLVRMPLQIWV